MERKQKIELLTGIANGSIPLKNLMIKEDPIIVDDNDDRPLIQVIKSNNTVILSKDFERLEASGLIKGFVIDLRSGKTQMYQFN